MTRTCKYGRNGETGKCNSKPKSVTKKRECKYGRNEETGKCKPKPKTVKRENKPKPKFVSETHWVANRFETLGIEYMNDEDSVDNYKCGVSFIELEWENYVIQIVNQSDMDDGFHLLKLDKRLRVKTKKFKEVSHCKFNEKSKFVALLKKHKLSLPSSNTVTESDEFENADNNIRADISEYVSPTIHLPCANKEYKTEHLLQTIDTLFH
jgi:hypothetical protein